MVVSSFRTITTLKPFCWWSGFVVGCSTLYGEAVAVFFVRRRLFSCLFLRLLLCFKILFGETRKGGSELPLALTARAMVTNVPLSADVTAPTCLVPFLAISSLASKPLLPQSRQLCRST
ncbi:hypothetical protein AVEN_30706-1 [Araneus ventricosus]|uniref:Uncharacterized protein n=1 Tax=Araneus ventricosus TaxID=182803 RepID=A0A4Y2J1B0_ARAVE|nr:hypothetical protein AVEN_30706-1 [Araneus ventricosus]